MNVPPPSWQPDPSRPEHLRWWDGRSWTGHVAPPVTPASRSQAELVGETIKAGGSGAVQRWTSWLAIAHLTLVPLLVAYLAMVAVNSWVYGYSFWNDSPPTDRADTAAVASLWCLAAVAAFVGAFGWGWMCRHALDGASIWGSGRSVLRPFIRTSWYATPLMVVTVVSILLVVPGMVAVALVGVAPFLTIAPVRSADGYTGLVSRAAGPLALVGCIALPLGTLFWGMVAVTSLLAATSPALAWCVGWACFSAGAILLGGAAAGFAHIYRESQPATRP